jgi:hypothetical protein
MKIVLAGMIYFQKCPPALSLGRYRQYLKMRQLLALLTLTLLTWTTEAQFPFEKYPAISYKNFNDWQLYDRSEKEKKFHHTLSIPDFYADNDTLTIQLTSFTNNWDSSFIRIFKNKKQIQKFFEPMGFSPSNMFEPIRVADINGDGLSDLKLIVSYNGTGTACLNVRIIYLFQKNAGEFTKISFNDMMDENKRQERDFDGDKNFEIITMNLRYYGDHSYWLFNLYNFDSDGLLNVNWKDNYPIMTQFLLRDNFEITNKISREKMKEFTLILPEKFDKK